MKKLYYYILATPLLATAFCALLNNSASAFESNVNIDWTKTLDGENTEELHDGALLPNGNVLVVGTTNSATFENGITLEKHGYYDALIMEVKPADGSIVWMKNYNYDESSNESLTKIIKTSDGNYIATGTIGSNTDTSLIVKLTPSGNILWATTWGGNGNHDEITDMVNTSDGNLVLVTNSNSTNLEGAATHGDTDAVLIKLDIKTGEILKQVSWGGEDYEYAFGVAKTKNDTYLISGILYSTDIPGVTGVEGTPGFVAEFDADFNNKWTTLYTAHPGSETLDIAELDDGSIFGGGFSAWVTTNPISLHFETYTTLYDKSGNKLWQNNNQLSSLKNVPTAHYIDKNGYIETGLNNTNGYDKAIIMTKFSPINGAIVWQKNFGISYNDSIRGIVPLSNHEYLVLGYGSPAESGVGQQIAMAKISEEVKADVEYHINSAEAPKNANTPTDGEVVWSKNNDGVSVPSARGWLFDGWYIDEAMTIKYNPSTTPASDLQLYGAWDKDPNAIDNPDTDDNIPKVIIYTLFASALTAPLAAYTLKRR